jgi:hypothetical protein
MLVRFFGAVASAEPDALSQIEKYRLHLDEWEATRIALQVAVELLAIDEFRDQKFGRFFHGVIGDLVTVADKDLVSLHFVPSLRSSKLL